jgi:RimJ/RimL family protein N-acetyltransferase
MGDDVTAENRTRYSFRPLDEHAAREIVRWAYDPPYDVYNSNPENTQTSVTYMSDPANGLYGIRTKDGELIAFCSYGGDAQVPGGDYGADALDIGLGVRPDLTGRGMGIRVIEAVLEFGAKKFQPERFRVTIAAFNLRARKAWMRAGFSEESSFRRKGDRREFGVFLKPGGNPVPGGEAGS